MAACVPAGSGSVIKSPLTTVSSGPFLKLPLQLNVEQAAFWWQNHLPCGARGHSSVKVIVSLEVLDC